MDKQREEPPIGISLEFGQDLMEQLRQAQARIKWLEAELEFDQRNAAMSQAESLAHLNTIDHLAGRIKELKSERDQLIRAVADHVTVRGELALQNQALRSALENHNGNYKLTKSEAAEITEVLNQPNLAADILAERDAKVLMNEADDWLRATDINAEVFSAKDVARYLRRSADELTKAKEPK